MRRNPRLAALFLVCCSLMCACTQETKLDIIPQPQQATVTKGHFTLDNNVAIKGNAEFEMEYLKDKLAKAAGVQTSENGKKIIEITIDPQSNVKEEGYTLSVTPDKISIIASAKAGAFYGVQTLLQMMPEGIYSEEKAVGKIKIPCAEIEDYPRFGYRGAGLDVSRTFFPLETIYDFIDWISYHKINTFHWHITDDNGWRIEIKKYPLLTEKGAWRGPDEVLPPSYGSGNKRYGGFYTQEEINAVDSLPQILVDRRIKKVMPSCKRFSINHNRLYGKLPDWLLYHPALDMWMPQVLLFPQEGRAKNGTLAVFDNEPATMDYYYDVYTTKKRPIGEDE